MPDGNGRTSIIKGHGQVVYRDTWQGPYSSPGDTEYEINSTAEKAILLIRNPYDAIYGYRHYIFTGLKGRADNSKFKGNGMFTRTGILPPSFLKCAMNMLKTNGTDALME